MVSAADLKKIGIFACLDDGERHRLAKTSADLRLEAGDWLIREGDLPWFFVLLEGSVQLLKDITGVEKELFRYGAGDFFGELPILLGTPVFVSMRAETQCRLARFDRQQLQNLIRESAACSAIILQTMNERLVRVQTYAKDAPIARVFLTGSEYDADCRNIRGFLAANRIPYEWVSHECDRTHLPVSVPESLDRFALIVDGDRWMDSPTVRAAAEALGLHTAPKHDDYDVVIAGAGPAGLAACVYGASEGLKVLMIERFAAGGQAGTSSRIENYLGFPGGISGDDLSARALKQAGRFGAEIVLTRCIKSLTPLAGRYCVQLDDDGRRVAARSVVLATGVEWRRLEIEGLDRLQGRGVLYGASRTEAIGINGKAVFIVGGGNSAGQAAMFFSSYAAQVVVVVRGAGLELSMSQYLIDQLASKSNISIEPFTQVQAVEGEQHLERIVTSTRAPGEEEMMKTRTADGLFIMIGADANTGWLPLELERDSKGYVRTGRDLISWTLNRSAFPLETSLPGVFCAGDVRHESIKRVSSGVGEGSMAIAFVHQYLALGDSAAGVLSAKS